MSDFAWYVMQSQPRKEAFVRRSIQDLGRETFLPLVAERVPGRRNVSEQPLFPCYLFARLSEAGGDIPRFRWMQGVNRILGDGRRARPVADFVVDTIRANATRRGRVRLGTRMQKGDKVRILEGPLSGLVGILEQPNSDSRKRVFVLLELFHRLTRIEIPAGKVRVVGGRGLSCDGTLSI